MTPSLPGPHLTIHRCAHEIGGNCIEIVASDGSRILLDAGRPLWAARDADLQTLVPATLDTAKPTLAVLISHPHLDHWGLLGALPATWPVWTGPASCELIRASAAMDRRPIRQALHAWQSGKPTQIGPFTVTPRLVDHSAFDAYMLQIDVDGRRLLYTGDFRRHGRKRALVDRLMDQPPANVDVLLTEGTNLGRDRPILTEEQLSWQFVHLFRRTSGRVFVAWSAQNVDRTVTLYRACLRAKRTLVVDLYTAQMMHLMAPFARLPVPGPDYPNLKVLVTSKLAKRCRILGQGDVLDSWQAQCGVTPTELARNPRQFVVAVRHGLLTDYTAIGVQPRLGDSWSFSLWRGYLDQPHGRTVTAWFDAAGAHAEHLHTSGHATHADLRAFAAAIAAKRVVPIHGDQWDDPAFALPRQVRVGDGDKFVL